MRFLIETKMKNEMKNKKNEKRPLKIQKKKVVKQCFVAVILTFVCRAPNRRSRVAILDC